MSDWHILVVTRGGTVSLLKNLTEDVARQTMQRLTPVHRQPGFIYPPGGYTRQYQGGDVEQLEAFGPEGVKLEVWPKITDQPPAIWRMIP